jgi:hypothetical protein
MGLTVEVRLFGPHPLMGLGVDGGELLWRKNRHPSVNQILTTVG